MGWVWYNALVPCNAVVLRFPVSLFGSNKFYVTEKKGFMDYRSV